jgi:hypothetical protein
VCVVGSAGDEVVFRRAGPNKRQIQYTARVAKRGLGNALDKRLSL